MIRPIFRELFRCCFGGDPRAASAVGPAPAPSRVHAWIDPGETQEEALEEVHEAMTPAVGMVSMVVETREDRESREAREAEAEAEAEVHLDTIADAAIPCVLAGLGAMVRFIILEYLCDGYYSYWQVVEDRILDRFPAGVPCPENPFMIRCVRFKPFARDVCRSLCTKTDDRRARDPGFRRDGDGGSPPWRSTTASDWWRYAVQETHQHNASLAIGWHVAALTALAADPQTDTWDKLSARYVALLRSHGQ